MLLISPQTSLSHGLETNVNGGTYRNGAAYAMTKKLEVEEAILMTHMNSQNGVIDSSEVARGSITSCIIQYSNEW